jgi:hypothetical protein
VGPADQQGQRRLRAGRAQPAAQPRPPPA